MVQVLRTRFLPLVMAAMLALPGVVSLPATQAIMMRWTAPRLTLTMVSTTLSELRAGRLTLPESRFRRLEHMGQVPRAVVTSEDGKFYAHRGFDLDGICAALEHNQKGGSQRGGSTISQQTARNLFLSQNRSWVRKGLEAYYTVWLEAFVPKDRILELYLNIAETGPQTFGFEAGSRHWFDKRADALTRNEASRLASVLPSPRRRTPHTGSARKKASWIASNWAPVPGDRGFAKFRRQIRSRPWWPLCP